MARVLCVGHAVEDFIFGLDNMPDRAEKFRARSFHEQGGGPAATAAVAIARLGGEAILATRLGDDPVGDLVLAGLARYGVDTGPSRRFSGCRSSLSSVFLDGAGERMIVNYIDPALPTDPSWLETGLLDGVDAVLGDCRWPEGAAHLLKAARARGLPAILDADLPMSGQETLAKAASHIAFSEPGLADYRQNRDAGQALAEVHGETGAWCAVTLGHRGTLCRAAGGQTLIGAFAVDAVDTLGAGDVWHGAFALSLAEGQDAEDAVRFANGAAALRVSRKGGRDAIPDRRELDNFLARRLDTRS